MSITTVEPDLVSERNDALERVMPVIEATARRWSGYARVDADDLAQIAAVRFLRTWPAFKRERGPAEGFAVYCVRGAASGRRAYALELCRREVAKAVPVNQERDADRRSPDPVALAELADELHSLKAALREIPKRYVGYLISHYSDGLSYRELADRDGLDVAEVSSKLTSAVQVIRRKLGLKGPGRRRARHGAEDLTALRAATRRAKRVEAAALRRTGVSAEEVAARLGMTTEAVSKATKAEPAPVAV